MSHVNRTINHIYKIQPPSPLQATSAGSQNCLSLTRANSVVGGPQLYREDGEDEAQRDRGASEAAAAGKKEPPTGPSGKIGGGMQLSTHTTRGCRRPKPKCSL